MTYTEKILSTYFSQYKNSPCITATELDQLIDYISIITKQDKDIVRSDLSGMVVLDIKKIKLDELTQRSSGDQRTTDWLQRRHNFITASTSSSVSGVMGKAGRETLLIEKATYGTYKPFRGGFHTSYGNLYEPVAKLIYCYRNNTMIHDFGLIGHQTISYLGASTDGVTSDLENIEIKSLSSREIDGKIKKEYYHQMQHQMECLGLHRSIFIEGKYEEYLDGETYYDDFLVHDVEKGIIIEVYNMVNDELEYIYSPSDYFYDMEGLQRWHAGEDKRISNQDNLLHVRDIYWILKELSCIPVPRDKTWAKEKLPLFKEFWDEVVYLRGNPGEIDKLIKQREDRISGKKLKKTVTSKFGDCLL